MSKRLLIVAYHFPPLQGSTGIHRTLAFAKYLQQLGWEITVLTAHPRAYPEVREENCSLIAPGIRVVRAQAFDAQRHLSILGRYPSWLALPDRWQSWIPFAIASGLALVRRWRPDAILSTYPLASAHRIGHGLHRFTGIPWIADFRDPMAQENYPTDPRQYRSFVSIERAVFRHAARVTTTTAGTAALYAGRFPEYPAGSIRVIPNGFDEEMFAGLSGTTAPDAPRANRKLTLVHSGILYPHERNPDPFFQAVAQLSAEGRLAAGEVEFVFRGSGNEEAYSRRLSELGITDLVKLLPAIQYQAALREIAAADALMLFQAASCNLQIPAKAYEYLYVARPVLALTDAGGDTARLLRSVGIDSIMPLDDVAAIKAALPAFLDAVRAGSAPLPERAQVMRLSRRASAEALDALLEEVITSQRTAGNPSRVPTRGLR